MARTSSGPVTLFWIALALLQTTETIGLFQRNVLVGILSLLAAMFFWGMAVAGITQYLNSKEPSE